MIRWDDLFKIGFGNLVKRKLRTFLTLLGVVIGTAFIVVMISLGNGMSASFEDMYTDMGSINSIEVMESYGGHDMGRKKAKELNEKSIKELKELSDVNGVLPLKRVRMKFVLNKHSGHSEIFGTDVDALESFGLVVFKGKMLKNSSKDGVLFGYDSDQSFYNPRDRNDNSYNYDSFDEEAPYDPKVDLITQNLIVTSDYDFPDNKHRNSDEKKPNKHKVRGVGVLSKTGNWQFDNWAYISMKMARELIRDDAKINADRYAIKNLNKYDKIFVRVNDIEKIPDVQKEIKKLGYEAYSEMDYINSIKEQMNVMKMILAGIGSVSMLVAAISIANTMIMSIYERTKEIGVLKVIGASLPDIKKLFLIESGIIGFVGGVFGVLLSLVVSQIVNIFGQDVGYNLSLIDWQLAVGGIIFASAVGLVSGYFPANKAMKLSVLSALRNNA